MLHGLYHHCLSQFQFHTFIFQLEKVVVTFNCGETTMNFAEAALLIQGSACVYSKKVSP